MEKMLTVEEAAEVLRLSAYSIRRWTKSGKLKARKVGHRWLIPESAVQAIIQGTQQSEVVECTTLSGISLSVLPTF